VFDIHTQSGYDPTHHPITQRQYFGYFIARHVMTVKKLLGKVEEIPNPC
jgi:hypothetical protein